MPNPTLLLIKDELVGFAKSKVMLVLWVILPILATAGFLILPESIKGNLGGQLSATAFMSLIVANIAGTIASLMLAVDIVSEKNRKVYELFIIRPIPRRAIVLSKFVAVFVSVAVACLISVAIGIAVDWVRGYPLTGSAIYDALKSMVSLIAAIALSASVGVFFGVISKTILVAVILILFCPNLAIVPMLPMYFGILPESFWMFIAISVGLVALVLWGSVAIFRRSEF
ncbi:MAG: ABC transporter permease [Myxococcota bacterium]|nr:ABC transporter permease [Deltaproteobacteria bacterium]MDQ3338927.1 ABC transporter permease [Myxococcota bacterium]